MCCPRTEIITDFISGETRMTCNPSASDDALFREVIQKATEHFDPQRSFGGDKLVVVGDSYSYGQGTLHLVIIDEEAHTVILGGGFEPL